MFPELVKKGELFIYQANGSFYDIGVPEDYHLFVTKYYQPFDEGFQYGD